MSVACPARLSSGSRITLHILCRRLVRMIGDTQQPIRYLNGEPAVAGKAFLDQQSCALPRQKEQIVDL